MFYGLDVHKAFIQVCELSPSGERLPQFRIGASVEEVETFAAGLGAEGAVVLDAISHTWAIARALGRHAGHSGARWNPHARSTTLGNAACHACSDRASRNWRKTSHGHSTAGRWEEEGAARTRPQPRLSGRLGAVHQCARDDLF